MLHTFILGVFIFGTLCSASSDLDIAVLAKLRDLETRLVEQAGKLAEQGANLKKQEDLLLLQGSQLAQQQRLIDQQQQTINDQQQEIVQLKVSRNKQDSVVAALEKTIASQKSISCLDCSTNTTPNTIIHSLHARNVQPSFKARQLPERVAFTAYLDQDLTNLGIGHAVAYNRVLLNEGSAYHPSSGIFTCPISGLYGFYFSVSTTGTNQSVAKLVKEGVNQVDAISDTFHVYHEAQGSNFAVLSLTQGQQVWVANYRGSSNMIHDTDLFRFSTFSGFLLY